MNIQRKGSSAYPEPSRLKQTALCSSNTSGWPRRSRHRCSIRLVRVEVWPPPMVMELNTEAQCCSTTPNAHHVSTSFSSSSSSSSSSYYYYYYSSNLTGL
ncbi:hypothetical protein CRUP_008399 [Coryphaenoides rupestris]|nr:hypothetical protein CRUP_008399 [Coryphaenoides rupestris]